jgi:ribonuclease P protein component
LQQRRSTLPKSARLRTKEEYKSVFDGATKSSDAIVIVLARRNQLNFARLGLAISKKCSKFAVERNRIKRLARECFRVIQADLSGIDFVILCRARAAAHSNAELLASISHHIQKVHARLCGKS